MASLENERFPKGLRVLVVDDDNTSLKLMDNLLRKCHFHVTTTNQAKEALRILKANKNKYDIVISDVEMPDMNGIKLLQILGLEMDLPVIMLSAYSDTKRVMDGVRNGACDYLVKPVRIQELQNIWQHIVRRKQKAAGGGKCGPGRNASGNRRDGPQEGSRGDNNNDDDDDDDDMDEGGQGNEDPATQKKPRLFWSVELHQKFVDAVNQLGLDKAFPKKILDLMNVEGLTREKVASHLQKYRLYLRKISSGSNLQAGGSRLVSVGTEDSLAHIGGGYGVYRSLAGPASYPGYSSLPDHAGGVLGRLNAATGVASFRGISSSPLLQTSQFPNSFNAATVRFDPFPFSANQNASYLLQANPTITTMQMNNRLPLLTPPTTPTSSMMLNTREFDTQSSSNLGINMSLDSTAKVSWGKPIQPVIHPLSSPQNLLPIPSNNNVSAADITPPNAQTHNDNPLDFLFGTSSMGHPNAQIQDRPSSLNDFNIPAQGQQVQKPNYFMNLCNISNASSSLIPAVAPTQGENNNNITAVPSLSQLEDASPQSQQQNDAHKSFDDSTGQNSTESLDDIVGRFLKQGNGEAAAAPDLELDPFLMK